MRVQFVLLTITVTLAAAACQSEQKSTAKSEWLSEKQDLIAAKAAAGPRPGQVAPSAQPGPSNTVPRPSAKKPVPPPPPANCRVDGSCDRKCDDASLLFPAGPRRDACLEACKQTDGGHEHLPGAFMHDCNVTHPPNGCGPAGFLGAVVPNGTRASCCDTHDACYLGGGDAAARCACDRRFAMCITQNNGGGAALTYFEAVRKRGCKHFDWSGTPPGPGTGLKCGDYNGCPL